ncbi:MAG: hypothetical protein R3C58_04820 [Parvularculaceae bacterium]
MTMDCAHAYLKIRVAVLILVCCAVVGGCHGVSVVQEANNESRLSDAVDLKVLMQQYRRQSYLHWITNSEGLPADEASLRADMSAYPNGEALGLAIERDFGEFFGENAEMRSFVSFMEAHGSERCVLTGRGYALRASEEIDGAHSCNIVLLIPLAYSQKVLAPQEEHRQAVRSFFPDSKVPTREEFLYWQENVRFIENWTVRAIADADRPTKINGFRFERELLAL